MTSSPCNNNDRRALGMTNTHVAIHKKTGLHFVAGRGGIAKEKDASRFDGENSSILAVIRSEWSSDFWTMQVAWGSEAIAPPPCWRLAVVSGGETTGPGCPGFVLVRQST